MTEDSARGIWPARAGSSNAPALFPDRNGRKPRRQPP
jgi:hypothetical protein